MAVQNSFSTYPGEQFIGTIAHPSEPYAVDTGLAYVPSSGRELHPGDCVYYDQTNNGFAVPVSAANLRLAIGIVIYGPGHVPDSSGTLSFGDDEEVWILVSGVVWVRSGGSRDYGNRVIQDTHSSPDWKWDTDDWSTTSSSVANLRDDIWRTTFRCVSFDAANDDSMKVRILPGVG